MENRFYIEFISGFDGVFDYNVFDKETREQKRMSCSISEGVDNWRNKYATTEMIDALREHWAKLREGWKQLEKADSAKSA